MIRINLLPVDQDEVLAQGRIQLLLFLAALLAWGVILFLFYMSTQSELDDLNAKVQRVQQQVTQAEKAVSDADALNAQAEQLKQQLSVLEELKQKRTGPVKVLDELQEIMSQPRNEEARFEQLQCNWNVEWDTRRLWIETFQEQEGGRFDLVGSAASADDVAEFLQRMSTARHFSNIELDFVKAAGGRDGAGYVDFHIMGDLSYKGQPRNCQDG